MSEKSIPLDAADEGNNTPNTMVSPEDNKEVENPNGTEPENSSEVETSGDGKKPLDSVAERIEAVKNARDTANHAIAATQHSFAILKTVAMSIGGTLSNPIFQLLVALVIFSIGVYSAGLVFGHNDNVDGCLGSSSSSSSSGDSGVSVSAGTTVKDHGNAIGAWLTSHKFGFLGGQPMTKEQAAGVIGNMMRESASTLDPGIAQGGPSNPWVKASAPNSVLEATSGGGKAVGLVQWDSDRRVALAKFADGKGKLWSDLNTQLEYLDSELEASEGSSVNAKGFNKSGQTVDFYTTAWEEGFERAGVPAMADRISAAKEFLSYFTGSAAVETGGSCIGSSTSGSSADMSSVVNLAISIAYPPDQQKLAYVSASDPQGITNAPQAYKDAKKAAEAKGGADPMPNLYASCDRFVATVIKNTIDPKIPWGATSEQFNYLSKSPLWKRYNTKAEAKPGDIWVTVTNGHIILYIGNYKGVDSIASASHYQRVGDIANSDYLNANLVDTSGRQYAGFHFVGTVPAGTSVAGTVTNASSSSSA